MSKVKRVVIGIDFSDPAINAERWAASYLAPGAELVLVHVLEVPETPGFLRRRAEPTPQLVESARAGAAKRLRELSIVFGERRLGVEVRVGDPAAQIADVARTYAADLIVVGKHGVNVGHWGRLGTTAERLVRQAPVPVLLAFGAPGSVPRQILVALDDGPDIARVVEWARTMCANGGERLTGVHVLSNAVLGHMLSAAAARAKGDYFDDVDFRTEMREETAHWLEHVLQARAPETIASSQVAFGDPATEILAVAERLAADLIVVGSRGTGRVRQALLGSVARDVLRGATRPVLVVTAPEDVVLEEPSDIPEPAALAAGAR